MVGKCQKLPMSDQVQEEVVKAAMRFSKGQRSLYLKAGYLKKPGAAGTLVKGRASRCG